MKRKLAKEGIKTSLTSIAVNLVLAIVKGVTGVLGNSYALIADGIESFSDVLSSSIILSGLKLAAKPADKNHPYGHGKAEPIAAMFVSLALIASAIIISVQSIYEIINPNNAPAPFTLIVLVLVIITKELLFRKIQKTGEKIKSTAVKTDALHQRSDALTSAAVFVGISISLIGGDGYEGADDWAALIAAAIIIYNAYKLFIPAMRELMDTSPDIEFEKQIRIIAADVDEVIGLDKCRIRKMGFEYYVDLDVIVDGETTVREAHEIAHTVKDNLINSNKLIANVHIHIEPDDEERIKRQNIFY